MNLDPELANGPMPYCYNDSTSEFWFRLSDAGMTLSMQQGAGDCSGAAPTTCSLIWER